MIRGLLLGKFMPFHTGHAAMIDFALQHTDRLDVLVCVHPDEAIDGSIRYQWVKTHYAGNAAVHVQLVSYDPLLLPATSESSEAAAQKWAAWLRQHYPGITLFISSEPYGAYVAACLGINHLCFDEHRQQVPVSATAIRRQPLKHWNFIPPQVRPYFVKKIAVVGSESTGKSVLSARLATHYNTVFVAEAGREIVDTTQSCTLTDLYSIAAAHANAIIEKTSIANRLLFADTEITITRSYGTFLFNEAISVPEWVDEANRFDLYLFLETDCVFVQDGTRLEAADREKLNACHKTSFARQGISYYTITGSWQQRFETAVNIINREFFSE